MPRAKTEAKRRPLGKPQTEAQIARMRPTLRAQYVATMAAAERRTELRAEGVAYDETDADGVRCAWHREAVAEVDARLAEALAAKAATSPMSYTSAELWRFSQ